MYNASVYKNQKYMKIIHFFKDIVCLTGFSFGCLCVVAFLLFVAFVLILVGVIAHEPYKNNYVCFKSCHAFIAVMQVAWLVSLITLCIEFVVVLIYSFRGEFGPIKFFLRFFGTFLLIAGLVELAKRIYEHGGVGYVSPYEKLTRFAKPCFWEADPS